MKRSGVVLCGGQSSRMGRSKAWLPWFGRRMIEQVVRQIAPCVEETVVVASADLELPPGLEAQAGVRIVRDREPSWGPLAGIREGLAAASGRHCFVSGTDTPFLTPAFVDRVFEQAERCGRAVAPLADGYAQVLSAVYPREALGICESLLEAGVRRPVALLEDVGFERALSVTGDGPPPWAGFNTPDDYLGAVRSVDANAVADVEVLGRLALHLDSKCFSVPVGRLGEILEALPLADPGALFESGRLAKAHLVSLGGRDLVRDLEVPIGPGEQISLIDALAGG